MIHCHFFLADFRYRPNKNGRAYLLVFPPARWKASGPQEKGKWQLYSSVPGILIPWFLKNKQQGRQPRIIRLEGTMEVFFSRKPAAPKLHMQLVSLFVAFGSPGFLENQKHYFSFEEKSKYLSNVSGKRERSQLNACPFSKRSICSSWKTFTRVYRVTFYVPSLNVQFYKALQKCVLFIY